MPVRVPFNLHSVFDPKEILPWDANKYEIVKKLQDAPRNNGEVFLMRDSAGDGQWAVKRMPNSWMGENHKDFLAARPHETEMPWQDIGVIRFLNRVCYPYTCSLQGVFKDKKNTYVSTSFATEGDLFSWCETGLGPGDGRENALRPVVAQLLQGIQRLHDMSLVHRDISLENILLSRHGQNPKDPLHVKIIDFSMASTSRYFKNSVRGKSSYQAPELHESGEYDGFLADTFSVGVTLYAVFLKDYPWMATKPGSCKCFEFVQKYGLRAFMEKRRVRDSHLHVGEVTSEPVKQLLEGLLALNPKDRFTLGESCKFRGGQRRSVWDLPWLAQIDQTSIASGV